MLYLKCNDGISNNVDKDDLQMVWFESTTFTLVRMSKKVNFNDTNTDASFTAQYENTPIQIYWEFSHQKLKTFRWKILVVFIFLLKT